MEQTGKGRVCKVKEQKCHLKVKSEHFLRDLKVKSGLELKMNIPKVRYDGWF